ncbi:MAG: MinD/ParA family protein [Rhodoglobus sp.]
MATRRTTHDGTAQDPAEATGSVGELGGGGAQLATALPENLTFSVALPAPVHHAPDEATIVPIDEAPIDPGFLDAPDTQTRSVSVVPHVTEPVIEVEPEPEIPPLPTADSMPPRRRDRVRGTISATPEPASALTAERLVESTGRNRRQPPEGFWPELLYKGTLHLVNIGDSWRVRERKALEARIDKPFEGGTRFVPVLTRKGGVGKTTITTLLGMALADVREDRVIAIDANPDRGTLAERVNKQTRSTVRDVVVHAPEITAFSEFSTYISRDETRLDVLATDTDPLLSEAFDENDYNVVADIASRFYSLAITDCGTGIIHSVMRATLQRADSIVVVSGGSVDEARLASETLTWLEANNYGELVKNAVVAINTGTQGTNLVNLEEIEAHFLSRVRAVVRVPYDPQLATGSIINYRELRPITRDAARDLAALVVDGLPTARPA